MTISNEGSEMTQATRAADALPPEPVTLRAADGYALRGHVWRHRGGGVTRPEFSKKSIAIILKIFSPFCSTVEYLFSETVLERGFCRAKRKLFSKKAEAVL